ncbi:MAG: hypothetical protein PVG92_06820 [Holophagae bacterium]|jgi:hypothetical protein
MSATSVLAIAGIELKLEAPNGLSLINEAPLYRPFTKGEGTHPEPEQLPASLTIGDPVPDPGWAVLFDSGESWLAYGDGDDVVFAFRSPTSPGRFWWFARLVGGDSPIELLFDAELIANGGQGDVLPDALNYPLDQLLLMWLLATRRGCIVHAAGAARDGRGVVYVGRSGAGKTTLMRQLEDLGNLRRLSDDRIILRLGPPHRLYGTPWAGEGLVAANEAAEIAALVFIHQGSDHQLEPIAPARAAYQLLPTTSVPFFDEDRSSACIKTLDELVGAVPAYDLHCRPDPGVADVIEPLFEP